MLIGRENVANAEGAIIELVKNTYDADANKCIILFDMGFNMLKKNISTDEFNLVSNKNDLVRHSYLKNGDRYTLIENLPSSTMKSLRRAFKVFSCIYIIDDGEGMDASIIENNWMTIGTDNKEINNKSRFGRLKTGAKGIGRFALDRLGKKAEMITQKEGSSIKYRWNVNWEDFSKKNSSLDEIHATLEEVEGEDIYRDINNLFSKFNLSDQEIAKWKNHGTILKIYSLNDEWTDDKIRNIYTNLGALVPYSEAGDFDLFLYKDADRGSFGKVVSSICESYDYKLSATLKDGIISIKTHRNEFDPSLISDQTRDKLSKLEGAKEFPFRFEDLESSVIEENCNLETFFLGKSTDAQQVINELGDLEVTLYFMKRSYSFSDNDKYFFKNFNAKERGLWFDAFGGIRMYRDNFRVRPYGETGSSSFDWLLLGKRKAESPVKEENPNAPWRVGQEQVSGVIRISRMTNLFLQDKSNREGLHENPHFQLLKVLIIELTTRIERDRQAVIRTFFQANHSKTEVRENEVAAKKIIDDLSIEKSKPNYFKGRAEMKLETLTARIGNLERQNHEIDDEKKILRAMASSGLIVTSFAHELNSLKGKLRARSRFLRHNIQEFLNNYTIQDPVIDLIAILDQIDDENEQLVHWLEFTVSSIGREKRQKKEIKVKNYFAKLEKDWERILNERNIGFKINIHEIITDLAIKGLEIDLDSIFNNLITNSIDAFNRESRGIPNVDQWKIEIGLQLIPTKMQLSIHYHDNGPGLSDKISNPSQIFEPLYTTKSNGTGIGLWIVKSILNDYNGKIEFLKTKDNGFNLNIILPTYHINIPNIKVEKP